MKRYFDEGRWRGALQRLDWPQVLGEEFKALVKQAGALPEAEGAVIKQAVRGFFAERLERGEVALAETGLDLDAERLPIDTVVIHHTSAEPGYKLPYLNAVHLLNLYVPHAGAEGVWSGHFDAVGRQVFYGYHWLMRMDGKAVRLLRDEQIGWQAGNWEVNRRSVAICLDNDYEARDPAPEVLGAVARLIRTQYSRVKIERVVGHREVNVRTICPGNGFLDGWKERLIASLEVR